jgi:hypothetical protein
MEVAATLRFSTPCLGNIRKPDYDRMQRDPAGNIIFLPSWWKAALLQAATAINQHRHMVDKILPALVVEGSLTKIQRRYGRLPHEVHEHEGFDESSLVTVRFALAPGVAVDQFRELLQAVGSYIGFSPYRQTDCGFFTVVSLETPLSRRAKGGRSAKDSSNKKGGKSAPGNSSAR